MSLSETDLPAVGSRINYASSLGVVRFVGQVEGSKGIWLGVEWDDPRRGKHSGSKDGKQYFTCTVPNSATFVRPSASIVRGTSFLRALYSKYVEVPFESDIEKVMLGSSNGTIEVEAVGMNKVRSKLARLERLREVSLDMENVACSDASGEIRYKCPNIKGLDLSRSLVPSWGTIALIAGELPLLATLSLNFNRFQLSSQEVLGNSFARVRDLRLNATLTTWETMLTLLPSFPELLHLEMGLNRLDALTAPGTCSPSTGLTSLNFEGNQLTNWQGIMEAVSGFSRLDRLILSSNSLESISPIPSPRVKLTQIKHLALMSNGIRTWSDIDALCQWLPELQTLSISQNSIDRVPSSRPLIIARHSKLIALNASIVSEAERRDSEIFYLSFIAKEGPRSQADREAEFPRYRELCDRYGEPDEHREVQAETLKNRLIEVHFFRWSSSPPSTTEFDLSEEAFTLRVLPSMALRLLRSKLLKTIKAPVHANIRMWLILERGSLRELAEMDMELGNRPLEWWGIENECKIAVCV